MRRYFRPALGTCCCVAGVMFMCIPGIPLGMLLVSLGALALAPYVPAMARLSHWLMRRDRSGRLRQVHQRAEAAFARWENRKP